MNQMCHQYLSILLDVLVNVSTPVLILIVQCANCCSFHIVNVPVWLHKLFVYKNKSYLFKDISDEVAVNSVIGELLLTNNTIMYELPYNLYAVGDEISPTFDTDYYRRFHPIYRISACCKHTNTPIRVLGIINITSAGLRGGCFLSNSLGHSIQLCLYPLHSTKQCIVT